MQRMFVVRSPTRNREAQDALHIQRVWRGVLARRLFSALFFRLVSEHLQGPRRSLFDEGSDDHSSSSAPSSPRPRSMSSCATSLEEALEEAGRDNRYEDRPALDSPGYASPGRGLGHRRAVSAFPVLTPSREGRGPFSTPSKSFDSPPGSQGSARQALAFRGMSVIDVEPELAEEVVCNMNIESLHEVRRYTRMESGWTSGADRG